MELSTHEIEQRVRALGQWFHNIDLRGVKTEQGRFAAEVSGFPDIEFRNLSVYDVAQLGERFDVVLFMGVLYHLRHPLLALDTLYEHVVGGLLVFQSMQRGSKELMSLDDAYPFWEMSVFEHDATRTTRRTGGSRTARASRGCRAAPAS